jgi:hypothetical protein
MNNMSFGRTLLLASAILVSASAMAADKVALDVKLPGASFKGTPPANMPTNSYTEPYSEKAPAPLMVPAGLENLALKAKLSTSSSNVMNGPLEKLVDGDKEPAESSVVVLRKGTQWVQMDLGAPAEIFAVVIWHAHGSTKVYHDVIVQVSDDPEFKKDVKTVFNNDQDNSSNLGAGKDLEYFETQYGKRIDAKGVKGRYVRFYSKGSTESALNEYTELEVYGRPAK